MTSVSYDTSDFKDQVVTAVYEIKDSQRSFVSNIFRMKEKELTDMVEASGGIITGVSSTIITKRRYKRVRAKLLAKQLKHK